MNLKRMMMTAVMAVMTLGALADVAVPTGLATGISRENIPLSWNVVLGADAYEVWRGTTDDVMSAVRIASVDSASFFDSDTTSGVTYRYWVCAVSGTVKSDFSEMATGVRYPRAVEQLRTTSGASGIIISWAASPDATRYTIWRKDASDGGNEFTVGVTESTSITDTNATVGVEYLYWVGAHIDNLENPGFGFTSSSDVVLGVFVVPSVTDVVAKQRYPWNGLVDITCKVAGINGETNGLKLAVAAVMPDTGKARNVSHFWVVQGGTNSVDREVHVNGDYRLLWDAKADLGTVRYTNMVVRVNFDAHEKVQLWEDGPYWATTNIGAEKPEDYGYYFWWGDTVGYKREGDAWVASDESSFNFSFDSSNTQTYGKTPATLESEGWVVSEDGTYVLAPEHDAAQVQWGGGWRMPTLQEQDDLCSKCDWTWTTMNGVNGYIVCGKGDYAYNSIFLPCAGNGVDTSFDSYYGPEREGRYWSSVPDSDRRGRSAGELGFISGSHYASGGYFRYLGHSVRPVQGFTK